MQFKRLKVEIVAANCSRHCWECLGEAYLSRGSLNSALEAFTEVLKVQVCSQQSGIHVLSASNEF